MDTEITIESDSTPNESRPTSVNKEITKESGSTPNNENSNSKGRTEEGRGRSNTRLSTKRIVCSVILLVVAGLFVAVLSFFLLGLVLVLELLFVLVSFLIVIVVIVFLIVREIASPKKWTIWVVLEWIALVGFTGFLVASLSNHNLKNHLIWELELWKWSILLMVVVCGRLISQWIVNAVFLLISMLFAGNLEVFCFAYGLKEKNRVFVWWGLVLIAWLVLVIWFGNQGGMRPEETKMIVDHVTRALASLTVGGAFWLGKDLLLWSIAISFHSRKFFERILKAKFYNFVFETLTDPSPWLVRYRSIVKYGRRLNWSEEINKGKKSAASIQLFIHALNSDFEDKVKPEDENKIVETLSDRKSELEAATNATNAKSPQSSDAKIRDNRFKNACDAYKNFFDNYRANVKRELLDILKAVQSSDPKKGDNRLGVSEAFAIAKRLLKSAFSRKVLFSSLHKMDEKLPFTVSEVEKLFKLIGETEQKEDIKNWRENVKQEEMLLKSSLSNTRRGMKVLNKLARGIVLFLIVIVWLLMMKVLSTQAVAFILSQFFVLAFVFGDTCKRIFEGIVFVFVINPFDIGDRCLIEGREEEVFVKKISIQTTVFSRVPIDHKDDHNKEKDDDTQEKIVYPNSVLATKHICNFHKIPKLDMTDSVKLVVDASTLSIEQIQGLNGKLRDGIKKECPWIKDISVHVNGFEDGQKMKMGVNVTYNKLWKDNEEKSEWKSKIVLGLKQNLEDMAKDMTDLVEFVVDASTSIQQIEYLNARLRDAIKDKIPIEDISVPANGSEDGDKIKIGVYVTYKNRWKDNEEKSEWKSKIVLELKQVLEDMGISKDMTDSVEFVVDASTSIKQIKALNARLRDEVKSPRIKEISVHANGFEDEKKMKMGVYFTYEDLWKDNEQKSAWKSIIESGLKQIL